MAVFGPLPRLVFGAGAVAELQAEVRMLGINRPFLISDRGLERVGILEKVRRLMPEASFHAEVPENPAAEDADRAFNAYRRGGCDGVIALGGGSVLDTAKIVAALAGGHITEAAALLGRPELVPLNVAPLIAIPTTVGTGSESSPVAAIHPIAGAPAIGTRSPRLVPRTAICDPDLARSLPPNLIAATGLDALSHCIEGFFADPSNPAVDALALDGALRVVRDLVAATHAEGDAARASLMAAAFAGGAAIHKGLGPAHAIALACGDQHVHHGLLIALALPLTVGVMTRHVEEKAERLARAVGLDRAEELADRLRALNDGLGLPATYRAAGYRMGGLEDLLDAVCASPFNQTSPYTPSRDEYRTILLALNA